MEEEEDLVDPYIASLRNLYKTADGKMVFNDLWARFAMDPLISNTAELTYYLIGKRDLIIELFKDLELNQPVTEDKDNE